MSQVEAVDRLAAFWRVARREERPLEGAQERELAARGWDLAEATADLAPAARAMGQAEAVDCLGAFWRAARREERPLEEAQERELAAQGWGLAEATADLAPAARAMGMAASEEAGRTDQPTWVGADPAAVAASAVVSMATALSRVERGCPSCWPPTREAVGAAGLDPGSQEPAYRVVIPALQATEAVWVRLEQGNLACPDMAPAWADPAAVATVRPAVFPDKLGPVIQALGVIAARGPPMAHPEMAPG